MQTVAFIIGFFLLGFTVKRFISNTSTIVTWLNNYIVYIAMPSIIFMKMPALEFSSTMLIPAGFAWMWALIGGAIVLIVSRCFKLPRPLEGAAILLTILGNVSFLGYPMIQAFFNDEVLSYGIFYDQLGCFLILITVGAIIIALYAPNSAPHNNKQTVSAMAIAKQALTFPPLIALLIASFLPVEILVTNVEVLLGLLGKTLMPLALLVIGLQFQPQILPEHRLPLGSVIAIKMLVAPLLASLVFSSTMLATPVAQATIFQAAMPCMITPGIMAIQAGLSPRFCATLLGYSTLFSFVWLPVLAYLIG